MLARLTGTLESISANTGVVAAESGLAYEVLLPAFLADELSPRVGETVTLHTIQYLEAQSQGSSYIPRLIGFPSRDDRRFFELFTTVKGLGAKRALRALRAPFPRVAAAIADRDAKFLQTLPEIGKRLAETIVAELHGKVDPFVSPAHRPTPGAGVEPKSVGALSDAARQAIDALIHLGEARPDAEELVRRALQAAPAGDGKSALTPDEILAAAFALRS